MSPFCTRLCILCRIYLSLCVMHCIILLLGVMSNCRCFCCFTVFICVSWLIIFLFFDYWIFTPWLLKSSQVSDPLTTQVEETVWLAKHFDCLGDRFFHCPDNWFWTAQVTGSFNTHVTNSLITKVTNSLIATTPSSVYSKLIPRVTDGLTLLRKRLDGGWWFSSVVDWYAGRLIN